MISKEEFIGAVQHEFSIIRHLAAKLREEDLAYRPSEGQRSILETLQYVSFIVALTIESVATGDMTLFQKSDAASKEVNLSNFDQAMAVQGDKVKTLVEAMTDEQLAEEVDMWIKQSRALHCLMALKFAVAYKMQLFLFMKAAGHKDIGTINVWAGVDAPAKE